jgi:hypothetical protein
MYVVQQVVLGVLSASLCYVGKVSGFSRTTGNPDVPIWKSRQ